MSKKRQDILNHGESLFYNYGFHAVGIKKIVSESNVSLMTLYNHFESKESLILEILNTREQDYFSFLKKEINECKDYQSIALVIADAHMKWLENNESNGCLFLRAQEEYRQENKDISNKVQIHKDNVISFIKNYGLSTDDCYILAMQLEGATALSESTNHKYVRATLISSVKILFNA